MARFLILLFIFANVLLSSAAVGTAPPPMAGAEPPSGRKLWKHRSAPPRSEMEVHSAAAASGGVENGEHHKARDKSIAGGGVIFGGLATTFLVAIICYIRATRRHNSEVK